VVIPSRPSLRRRLFLFHVAAPGHAAPSPTAALPGNRQPRDRYQWGMVPERGKTYRLISL
jgi:hypothetical protein